MRGFSEGLLVSVFVHALVGAVVYAIPVDKFSKPETISVDFTLIDYEGGRATDQQPGSGLARTAAAGTKANGVTRSAMWKVKQQARAEMDMHTADNRRGQTSLGADPAQSEEFLATSSSDSQGTQGTFSSPDGVPVAGLSSDGSPGRGSGPSGPGGTNFASLNKAGAGASGDASGGGQGAILREIRDSIMKNVVYPEKARRMGWEGKVILAFTVYEDGSIRDARVMQSSGALILDDAAKEALRKSTIRTQFARRVQVVLPIEYKLK
ncbi:MAG TPA: energy transducer TonB [Syntrophorhabdales bacterium]|nr:energy transducer TonB [Syntrophorhabdales bacterium]